MRNEMLPQVRVTQQERERIMLRYAREGQSAGLSFSSWVRMVLLPPDADVFSGAIRRLEELGLGFLLDKSHPKVKEALKHDYS